MKRICLALLLCVMAAWQPAQALESILDFASDVKVLANGDLDVTEHIRINAEGDEFRHGLLRDFPTLYRGKNAARVQVGFDVKSVRRDGHDEPFRLEKLDNGTRIRIGSAETMLDDGEYAYEIVYRTTRQLGFFDDFDELYWNVTGNGWTFPILKSSVHVSLPSAAPILKYAFYTGPAGARGTSARVVSSKPGDITIAGTAPLMPGEGLTVAVAWPKGVVTPPSTLRILMDRFMDNLAQAVAILGFLLVAAYYVIIFIKTRRSTPKRIVPLFGPPDAMSAPAVRFLARGGNFDQQGFVVGMLELISLRAMRLNKTGEDTRFERLPDGKLTGPHVDPLMPAMLDKLFGEEDAFDNDSKVGSRYDRTRKLMLGQLAKRYSAFIRPNRKLASRGLLLWFLYIVISLGLACMQDSQAGQLIAISMPFTLVGLIGLTVIYGVARRSGASLGMAGFALLFLVPFMVGGLSVLSTVSRSNPWLILNGALPLLLLPVAIRAYSFVRGYSAEGYAAMDQIAGLKQYLTLAEGPRLQALVTPEEKLAVYERCLPYAVALDVGKQWAAAFAGLFAGTGAALALNAMQDMYGGHDLFSRNPERSVSDFGREVSATRIAASSSSSSPGSSDSWSSSSSSSSSSGSSDSGSSGGGGGGGGGSGW